MRTPGQRNLLSILDDAATRCFHFKAVIIAGMGFFTDAYDLFSISLVTQLLGRIYYRDDDESGTPGILPPLISLAINNIALVGALFGQLLFGWLGDKMGRKTAYGYTLALMVLCSVASGLSLGSTPSLVIYPLIFFRFWLGVGVGGDYPLSATIMAEYANKKTRGRFIAAVFAMQGLGIMVGICVTLLVSYAFNRAYPAQPYSQDPAGSLVPQADLVWRIILIFGSVPAALTFYLRMKMPETPRYTLLVARQTSRAVHDMRSVLSLEDADGDELRNVVNGENWGLFSRQFLRHHGRHLLATSFTWLFLDIAYYSQNLHQKIIFYRIGWIPDARTLSALDETYLTARAQAIVAMSGTIPGFVAAILLIDVIGRYRMQIVGFAMMTAFMIVIAASYSVWNSTNVAGFVVLYSLTFFFSNLGPNSTTFIVPAEIFPARLRSQCHGISAAAGKVGAIIGAVGFLYASQDRDNPDRGYPPGIGIPWTLGILAITSVAGMVFSFFLPETNQISLEQLSGETLEEAALELGAVDDT